MLLTSLAFLGAFAVSALVTPALFLSAVYDQQSVPGAGVFGAFTPLAALFVPILVLFVGLVAHRLARAAWSAAWLIGAIAGSVVILCLALIEWLQ